MRLHINSGKIDFFEWLIHHKWSYTGLKIKLEDY
jgi:hypothetical protein